MEPNKYWYAFQKESELRGALLQCSSDSLLAPYQLWRFEQEGDGKRYMLLSTERPIAPNWGVALEPESVRELQHVQFAQESSDKLSPPNAKTRLSLRERESGRQWSGWNFPLRGGGHLLAALGLEPTNARQRELAWVLFCVANQHLRELISDHLTLNNYELRCSHDEGEEQWLWVRNPELYLVLKFREFDGVEVYQSFEREKALFAPWGYKSSLGEQVQLPQGESLLVLDMDGSSELLDTTSWWMANEMVTIESLPELIAVKERREGLQIPVHLRYQQAESRETPRLWLLRGEEGLIQIESLFFELGPEERSAIGLYAGEESGEGTLFLLRDDRPNQDSPLFSLGRAVGFESFLPEEGFYIKSGYRVTPTLPSEVWRQEFELDVNTYTLLEPARDGGGAKILQIPQGGFAWLENFAHYRMGAHHVELQSVAQSNPFTLLFEPKEWSSKGEEQTRPKSKKAGRPGQRPTVVNTASGAGAAPSIEQLYQGASIDSRAKNPRLQQLEQRFQQAIRKGKPLTPQDWVMLASLYYREYKEQMQMSWLQETFKALDQVLYLDRHADAAVSQEVAVLRDVLQVEGLPFQEQMPKLSQAIQQESNDAFFGRLAFRLRARMLLDNPSDEEQALHLRLHFYRDLAAIEDRLMIREHYIYVTGVAQFLDDQELFERARLRYRQLLEDRNRLQRELPAILVQ